MARHNVKVVELLCNVSLHLQLLIPSKSAYTRYVAVVIDEIGGHVAQVAHERVVLVVRGTQRLVVCYLSLGGAPTQNTWLL